jgi:hypothetical protein
MFQFCSTCITNVLIPLTSCTFCSKLDGCLMLLRLVIWLNIGNNFSVRLIFK